MNKPTKGKPLIPKLTLGETIEVEGQQYEIILTGKLNNRNFEPLVGLKVVE